MELVIVRHSMSVDNHSDLISGSGSNSPLSEAGVSYAQKVADAYDWQRFAAVYASPMQRARETAAILTKGQQVIHTDARLTEMHFGEWEGQSADPYIEQFPEAFDYTGMFTDNYSDYVPGSESYPDVMARSASFIESMMAQHPTERILVVSHGMTIRGFLAAIFHTNAYDFGEVHNVALNQIHFDENDQFRPRLTVFNAKLV